MKRIRPIANHSDLPDLRDEDGPRTDPFYAPEDYFDELPQRIMERIAADEQRKLENPGPSPILRRVWMAAAGAAIIAVIFMMINPAHLGKSVKIPAAVTSAASLTDEYDQAYADEALMLEENTITEKDVATIDFKNMGTALSNTDTTSATPSEIIQYLLDDDDGIDLIAGL